MTREEAIDVLEEIKELDDSIYQWNTKYLKALDMAIQALEQQPSGDSECIYCKHCFEGSEFENATSEPKTGHWILLDECSNSGYYCSECHKKVVKEGWSNTVKKIKYCPNCGCRMVEPQERSE